MNKQRVKKRVTVAMVADRAGVSRAAVYAVLNSHKGLNIGVGEDKRKKIIQAINELGYIPNESAQNLVTGRSKNVGVIVPEWGENNIPYLMRGIIDNCNKNGYRVLPELSRGDSEIEFEKLRSLYSQNIASLIIIRCAPGINDEVLNNFVQTGVPVIVLGADDITNEDFFCISFDEQAVMEQVAGMLLDKGYHKIAYLRNNQHLHHSLFMRKKYLDNALQSRGEALFGDYSMANYDECNTLVKSVMASQNRPDAIVCYNDKTAEILMFSLIANGYRVPDDIAVVGVDGAESPFQPVALTTVKLPFEEMGRICWNIIDSVVNKKKVPESQQISLKPELVLRDSTI